MRLEIAKIMRDGDTAWTMMSGDFKWVCSKEDRVIKKSGKYTGGSDYRDERHFQEKMPDP